ncbi:unnamed protein product [Parnassius mnemosyne]|uniref:PiggyBac transposable element-derived protein domain-containing protein n=1 Tax=Parnassius mnemosyne TaxID=213953 RepID=A0AAV1KT98_9NEOP
MEHRHRSINDREIELQLEAMFGLSDGTDSEDSLEDSDTDDIEQLLSPNNDSSFQPCIEPDFADSLLTARSSRRHGKHGPEQATDEWEEDDDHEIEDEIGTESNNRRENIRNETSEGTTDCESDNEVGGAGNVRVLRASTFSATTARPFDSTSINTRDAEVTAPTALVSEESDSDEEEIEWKKVDWTNDPNVPSFDEDELQSQNHFPSRSRTIAYFEVFFDNDVIENLLVQSNLFARQSNVRNFTQITEDELKAYLGMLIQMGIHKLPSIEDYWSSNPALCVPEIAETMTLQRFQKISRCLHVNDNEQMPRRGETGFDKLYKIRPLLDQINQRCQNNARNTRSQSIDESMVKFKGRSTLKQYMPLKPVKRGYKIWARADSKTGYLFHFQVYTGKGDNVETGLGSSVVKTLAQPLIDEGCSAHISFDNFFSSYDLLQYLYDHGIYSTATARNDRLGMPVLVKKPTGLRNCDEIMKRQNKKLKQLQKVASSEQRRIFDLEGHKISNHYEYSLSPERIGYMSTYTKGWKQKTFSLSMLSCRVLEANGRS